MSDDACKKRDAGTSKEASGIIVYLMEELGDARLRCAQLKKYVHDATDLIEKSDHRDHFFEVAGNLIYGIPDTLLKLDKALDATALAAARLDYEEIKNGLRPEKADELETALNDTRLRYLNRRSTEEATSSGKTPTLEELKSMAPGSTLQVTQHVRGREKPYTLVKRQSEGFLGAEWALHQGHGHTGQPIDNLNSAQVLREFFKPASTDKSAKENQTMNTKSVAKYLNKIADLTDKQGRVPVAAVMTLVMQLERGNKRSAVLNSKASAAFRNVGKAIVGQKNPSRMAIAGLLRRIVGDTLRFGIQQQGQSQQQQQQQGQSQQQAGAGEDFQKANPKITDEEAKVIDEMHDEHKDVVKDKSEQSQQQQQ